MLDSERVSFFPNDLILNLEWLGENGGFPLISLSDACEDNEPGEVSLLEMIARPGRFSFHYVDAGPGPDPSRDDVILDRADWSRCAKVFLVKIKNCLPRLGQRIIPLDCIG